MLSARAWAQGLFGFIWAQGYRIGKNRSSLEAFNYVGEYIGTARLSFEVGTGSDVFSPLSDVRIF